MAQQRRYPITLDERLLATLLRQPICDQRMAGKGQFLPLGTRRLMRRATSGSRIRQGEDGAGRGDAAQHVFAQRHQRRGGLGGDRARD